MRFVVPVLLLVDASVVVLKEVQRVVLRKRLSASLLSLAGCTFDWTIADETAPV